MSNSLNKELIKGSLWSAGGQFGSLVVVLITNIWLTRLLSPQEFGQIGIIMFFVVLSNVFTEGGLAGALVRKTIVTDEDYSTVFIFNLFVSLCCYLLLIFSSDSIASYYNDDAIKNPLIVSGLVLVINAFQIVQNVRLIRQLKFKQISVYRLIAVIIASVCGVFSAYNGAGIWSLVIVQICTSVLMTFFLWVFERHFLRMKFSVESFKSLYAFGVNTTLASLLNTAFDNIYQLVLGRYFSISQVGFFYQAKKLQDVPGGIINTVNQGVVFSALSKLQEDIRQFVDLYIRIGVLLTVVLGSISTVVFLFADSIIDIIYGEKWIEAAFYMKLLSVASFFYFHELFFRVVFKVFNKTRKILAMELIKKGVQILTIVVGVYFLDLNILLYGFIFTSILGCFMYYFASLNLIKEIGYRYLKIILKVCLIVCIIVFVTNRVIVFFSIKAVYDLCLAPFTFAIYIIILHGFGIINIKSILKLKKIV
ncbi:MAG: lipopolysaccharide biosynthesis protein [Labilibaculum sp.]|nr:lipopolysaccharide biosynthesis protein [Labilibaculum sp.]MBI9059643.1 lipopolysaccharide biosynthesis protein [Labilibaculum sp.]